MNSNPSGAEGRPGTCGPSTNRVSSLLCLYEFRGQNWPAELVTTTTTGSLNFCFVRQSEGILLTMLESQILSFQGTNGNYWRLCSTNKDKYLHISMNIHKAEPYRRTSQKHFISLTTGPNYYKCIVITLENKIHKWTNHSIFLRYSTVYLCIIFTGLIYRKLCFNGD